MQGLSCSRVRAVPSSCLLPPARALSAPQPHFCFSHLIPVSSYVTYCAKENIQRVIETDRMSITKFIRPPLLHFDQCNVTCCCRYLMGVENFQQIKQVPSPLTRSLLPPALAVPPVLTYSPARNRRRHHRMQAAPPPPLFAPCSFCDTLPAVVRRQRAADPSQQDIPVDDATSAARAVSHPSDLPCAA